MSKKAFAFLALLLALCVAGSLLLGKYGFSAEDYARYVTALLRGESLKDFEVMHTLLLEIRLPRILACVLIGASLAISGAAYQAMFVNPLVSPSILGVLSGAGFGAAVGMFFKLNEYLIQLSTFGFGFLAVAVALGVSALYSRSGSVIVLVLGGVISGSLFTSLLSVLKYAADPNDALPAITYFLMGSLGFASKSFIEISILPMCAGVLLLALSGKYLNALSLGEEEAKSLGVNTARVKIFIVLVATFVSALSVTIAGIIGWIGLIVPHIARFIFGADNRAVLASSAMIGAIFLLFCDSFSRLIFTFEIPIGIVTSLFGIPMFIIVLRRTKRSF
ncbi:FecCD family ABC transporter permease [Campylobacter gracilis]|uniref:Iron chelate uptake ABC transporter, FeCT family, permease protein n=1 Tax=Campylobacter gracilis RM3268 TaxID=553220 RepID=C8PFT4_9BACT|nr:iron ABC transporter permease [Campylobacter gracilis]AKT92713.1 ABC transporter, permease protein [Campylobacter gracilis]EEV17972.1 iron chelate uptake ABC transporter, FeCT family, permease protein [Campylobacter gracilis RM3268]UEB45111.1 iron ABC transporter permease [Campylobacter gracilis]SUW82226.1 ABC transporter permease [Campylobacter gracilis]